jgi:glutamate transport system permease protein
VSAPTAVLFDAPGPKARARNTAAGVVTLLVVAALIGVIIWRMAATGQLDPRVWEWILYENVQLALLDGLFNTLRAFASGAVLALILGALLALGRLSDHRWLRSISGWIVELFRAVPLVVLMFLFYYGLPSVGITVSTYAAVVLGLTLYNGAVLAEIFRAGVLAVPRGQSEAAYALGLRKSGVMRFVLLPQAVRSMLPAIVSQLVVLLKDTALGYIVAFPEMLQRGVNDLSANFGNVVAAAMVIAAIYIVLNSLLTLLANWLDRRTSRRGGRTPKVADAPVPSVPQAGGGAVVGA